MPTEAQIEGACPEGPEKKVVRGAGRVHEPPAPGNLPSFFNYPFPLQDLTEYHHNKPHFSLQAQSPNTLLRRLISNFQLPFWFILCVFLLCFANTLGSAFATKYKYDSLILCFLTRKGKQVTVF